MATTVFLKIRAEGGQPHLVNVSSISTVVLREGIVDDPIVEVLRVSGTEINNPKALNDERGLALSDLEAHAASVIVDVP